MQALSEDGRRLVGAVAQRHGVSADAALHLLLALAAGGGRQAQFNHPELGGMGQWSQGGMTMIGDMFNNGLKQRVDAMCSEITAALQQTRPLAPVTPAQGQSQPGGGTSLFVKQPASSRWPAELGVPASAGSQNDLDYAVFPASARLAIKKGKRVTVYDTGDHRITGFSQQQGGDQSLTFTSQHGLVRLEDLKVIASGKERPAAQRQAAPTAARQAPPAPTPEPAPVAIDKTTPVAAPPATDDEIFSRIERLADLRKKDIITAEEFDAKKAELLARL